MTTTTNPQPTISFQLPRRHAGMKLVVIGLFCVSLAAGFVASVEQSARQAVQGTELSAAQPASAGATVVAIR
jgi:hypothetical protein